MAPRLLAVLVLAALLAGCAGPSPRAPPDPAAVALTPADVAPGARLAEETSYPTARALAESTPDWASEDDLEAWGFRAALARIVEERPDGPLVNHVVYVFNASVGAREAFTALDGLFQVDPWKPVGGAERLAEASALYRLDVRGGSGFVLVLQEGPVVAQVLAVGETMTEARLLGWGRTLSGRLP